MQTRKEQIVIVEDENDLLELLEYTLQKAGYDVIGCLNTKHVKQILQEEKVDLIIMDRNLPDIEGSLYVELLRSKNIDIPVIFLSAKSSKREIREGFLSGADDYITKPFDVEELILRIKAVLRRYSSLSSQSEGVLEYRDLKLDLNTNIVEVQDGKKDLTKLEVHLLRLFFENRGRVLDRDFLLKQIWGGEKEVHPKTVNVAIKRLKEKIDPTKEKNYIKTIRGFGYMLP